MSYHDSNFIGVAKRLHRKSPVLRLLSKGARQISFRATMPQIRLGSVADDWQSVGDDIRSAMNCLEKCD